MFAASVIVFVVASLMTDPPPAEQVEETTWSTETWRKESEELAGKPKWKNYRYLAGALFVFTILIVIPFV